MDIVANHKFFSKFEWLDGGIEDVSYVYTPDMLRLERYEYALGKYEELITKKADRAVERGGPGSGHHGHAGRPGEVGGSLPDIFSSLDRGTLRKGLLWYLNHDLDNEVLKIYDRDGYQIEVAEGNSRKVSARMSVVDTKDGFSIHNHPTPSSVSDTDASTGFKMMEDTQFVIDPNYIYAFRWDTKKDFLANNVLKTWVDLFNRTRNETRAKVEGKTEDEKLIVVGEWTHELWMKTHSVWPTLFTYERIRREDFGG